MDNLNTLFTLKYIKLSKESILNFSVYSFVVVFITLGSIELSAQCNTMVDLGADQTFCNNPITLNANVSNASNCTCQNADQELLAWYFIGCSGAGNEGYDYSELLPTSLSNGNCNSVSGTNVWRDSGRHSCAPGISGGTAVCIGTMNSCDPANYDPATALKFQFTMDPSQAAKFSGLEFYELAPTHWEQINNGSGPNNYPTKYLIRVYKNNNLIYSEDNINTTQSWSLESFDFSNDPAFEVTTTTTFRVELRAYCLSGVYGTESLWDIDNISVFGGCCASGGSVITYDWSNGMTSQSINVNAAGTYAVTVTDCSGCTASDEVIVTEDCGSNCSVGGACTTTGGQTGVFDA